MSLQTSPDINVNIIVLGENPSSKPLVSAERRVTPSWTISQLKSKLEPVTGIPVTSQRLRIRGYDGQYVYLDDDIAQVGDRRWNLTRGSELEIVDLRPPAARQNFTDVSSVEKYQMPEKQYEQLTDSVLAWKKKQKLGRFDPNARSGEELATERKEKDESEIKTKGIKVGLRCRVGEDDGRRGEIRFVGEIEGLGGEREAGCVWIGVQLDEPVGKNDGSVKVEKNGEITNQKIFECQDKFGVFARPEKVEVGEWPPLDDLMDEDMEEI